MHKAELIFVQHWITLSEYCNINLESNTLPQVHEAKLLPTKPLNNSKTSLTKIRYSILE